MIYDLSNENEFKQAKTKLDFFASKGKRIELKSKNDRRSISQNSYLHLVLTAFGLEFGYSLDEVKREFFKKLVNHEIFYLGSGGELVEIEKWRSTADLDTKEMTLAIDRFLDYSATNGYRLPEPSDLAWISELEKEIENNKRFL